MWVVGEGGKGGGGLRGLGGGGGGLSDYVWVLLMSLEMGLISEKQCGCMYVGYSTMQ